MRIVAAMLDLILPWFPIVLSAAIGARLVERARAPWLGAACALYFVVLVQMTAGVPVWTDAAIGAAVLAGAAAILGIAEWSSRMGDASNADRRRSVTTGEEQLLNRSLADGMEAFDEWLEAHRYTPDIWASLDEFLRAVLYRNCGATHVRPYRILSEGDAMVPLHVMDERGCEHLTSARQGIPGYVATTGRSYYASDVSHGKLVDSLAARMQSPPDWCFCVRQGAHTIGIVSIGRIEDVDGARPCSRDAMRAWELLVGQFWTVVNEVCRGRTAVTTDAVSQLMTRDAFIEEAQRAVAESYNRGEPLVMCVVAVEGLRALLDRGRWDLAKDVIHQVGRAVRDRVRPDDLLGCFDDARLMLMLRRVDSELASLIATQLTEHLTRLPVIAALPNVAVRIRCGMAGSGTGMPSAVNLVATAVRLCHEARKRDVMMATDLPESRSPVACAADGSEVRS